MARGNGSGSAPGPWRFKLGAAQSESSHPSQLDCWQNRSSCCEERLLLLTAVRSSSNTSARGMRRRIRHNGAPLSSPHPLRRVCNFQPARESASSQLELKTGSSPELSSPTASLCSLIPSSPPNSRSPLRSSPARLARPTLPRHQRSLLTTIIRVPSSSRLRRRKPSRPVEARVVLDPLPLDLCKNAINFDDQPVRKSAYLMPLQYCFAERETDHAEHKHDTPNSRIADKDPLLDLQHVHIARDDCVQDLST